MIPLIDTTLEIGPFEFEVEVNVKATRIRGEGYEHPSSATMNRAAQIALQMHETEILSMSDDFSHLVNDMFSDSEKEIAGSSGLNLSED